MVYPRKKKNTDFRCTVLGSIIGASPSLFRDDYARQYSGCQASAQRLAAIRSASQTNKHFEQVGRTLNSLELQELVERIGERFSIEKQLTCMQERIEGK